MGKNHFKLNKCKSPIKISTLILILLAFLTVLLPSSPVSAHRIIIENSKGTDNFLSVTYEGGLPAVRAEVKLYNQNDEVVAEGPVDDEGVFYYQPSLSLKYAEASDGLGHMARYDFTENGGWLKALPLYARVCMGTGFLIILSIVFYVIQYKKNYRRRKAN
jgi:hypothetical protein